MHDNVNIVSTEQKLLYDIRELLIEQNKLLQQTTMTVETEVVTKPIQDIQPKVIKRGGKK